MDFTFTEDQLLFQESVRDFLTEAFGYINLDWNEYVRIDPRYFRPAEVETLLGDASQAAERPG